MYLCSQIFYLKHFNIKNILSMTKEKFMIRAYGKSEYAMMLFPHIDDPKVAQAKLLRWISCFLTSTIRRWRRPNCCAGSRRTSSFTRVSWGWVSRRTTRTIARGGR